MLRDNVFYSRIITFGDRIPERTIRAPVKSLAQELEAQENDVENLAVQALQNSITEVMAVVQRSHVLPGRGEGSRQRTLSQLQPTSQHMPAAIQLPNCLGLQV